MWAVKAFAHYPETLKGMLSALAMDAKGLVVHQRLVC